MSARGKPKITLENLAKLAGVSIATVSRALNDHPIISKATKQRIWALAREQGYSFRDHMPASPIGAEGSIAIVLPLVQSLPLPLWHPFFLELLANIGEAARAHDCDFTVSHVTPSRYDDLLTAVTTSRASGVIFLGQGGLHEDFNRLAMTSARFVVWGAQFPGQLYCSIGSDNLQGGKRATSHLVRLGRKRIVFLGGSDPEAMQRRRGYLDALAEGNLEADPQLIIPVEFELDSAEALVGRLLRSGVKFDAIFAASDLMALGAMRALRREGLSVPHDISLVGYDDMMLARLSTPALTTIRQDTKEAGRLLVSHILEPHSDYVPERLSTELIVRESCGA